MIYLQMGILILEIGLCILLNNLLKNKLNKKIRYAICIALLLICWNMRTYQAMWAVHTLFCLLVLLIVFKKRKPIICILLSAIISTPIVTFGYVNMYTIHQTTYNVTTTKEITNTLLKVKQNFYLLGRDFVDESTSKEDMEILFKQLGRLTKLAPVYFVYGNHENKIKFTRNKLNQEITKNNITILNDQEVHLNNIILIGKVTTQTKTERKQKTTTLQVKPTTSSWTINPKEQKKTLKTMSTFNSADILITDKCFHSLILTTYNLTLQEITAKKRLNITQKSLAQALLVGAFL